MQTINNNSILTGYIKQFLHDFNLPKASFLRAGMRVFNGMRYIDRNNIYECVKTSYFDGSSYEYLTEISPYIYGKKYLNITKNLNSTVNEYDYKTHEFLGDYLRFYRDYKNINLMSMYNCFGGRTGSNIDLSFKVGGLSAEFDSSNASFSIYVLPVKLQSEYTIAIDCSAAIEIVACLYDGSRVVQNDINDVLLENTYYGHSGNRFAKPFVYRRLKEFSDTQSAESVAMRANDLMLFVKVPAGNESSFTVLEGDWSDCSDFVLAESTQRIHRTANNYEPKHYIDSTASAPSKSRMGDIFIDRATGMQYRYDSSEGVYMPLSNNHASANGYMREYASRLQLLTVNDGASHPFADKLVGYLLGNVITSDDGISDNIRRLQKSLINHSGVGYAYTRNFGSWEPELRDYVYDLAVSNGTVDCSFDSIGFVDKDIEGAFGADISYDVGGRGMSGGTR